MSMLQRAVGTALAILAVSLLLVQLQAPWKIQYDDWAEMARPPSPPLPEVSGDVGEMRIADRRVVAQVIIDAMHEYYADHGEYPPYLFGGSSENYVELGQWDASFVDGYANFEVVPNVDPLIKGGYISNYPRAWPGPRWISYCGDCPCPKPKVSDARDITYWRCMYSTPGDFLVLGGPSPMLYTAALDRWRVRGKEEGRRVLATLDPADFAQARHYALGGRERNPVFGPYQTFYTAWPGEQYRRIARLYLDFEPVSQQPDLPFFGYQRGEWFGESPRSAWLWFYGSNIWPEHNHPPAQYFVDWEMSDGVGKSAATEFYELFAWFAFPDQPVRGLDLLNAKTGALEPDGISDGICLLYKLEDGTVVDVVRAEGI